MTCGMNFSEIIHDAWKLTVQTAKLKWMSFVPGFAAVIFFVGEIFWQVGLLSEELGILEHSFVYKKIGGAVQFLIQNDLLGWAIFILVFILLFQFVFPSWVSSSLILGIQRKYNHPERYLSTRQIILDGFRYFPKLVELHAIFSPFSFMTIAFFTLTMFRFFHGDLFSRIIFPVIIIFSIFALIVNFFTIFSIFFVVLEDAPVMSSIKKSIGLVFINLGATMTVLLLMALVSFRVIINVIAVLGVPIGILFGLSYFGEHSWFGLVIAILGIVGLGVLALSAYLAAIIEVFSNAVWIKVFTLLQKKEVEDLGKTDSIAETE